MRAKGRNIPLLLSVFEEFSQLNLYYVVLVVSAFSLPTQSRERERE